MRIISLGRHSRPGLRGRKESSGSHPPFTHSHMRAALLQCMEMRRLEGSSWPTGGAHVKRLGCNVTDRSVTAACSHLQNRTCGQSTIYFPAPLTHLAARLSSASCCISTCCRASSPFPYLCSVFSFLNLLARLPGFESTLFSPGQPQVSENF